jgi:hypothetical protein
MLATRPALLARPYAPNLLRFSEDFTQAAQWLKARATVTSNAIVAPDGTLTADKLVEDATASNTHTVVQNATLPAGLYTYSIYAKAAERTQFRQWVTTTPPVATGIVDLTTGAFVGAPGGTIWVRDAGNGWWRIGCRFATTHGETATVRALLAVAGSDTYSGDNASGAYLWGAQLTLGAGVRPYQKTL